VDIRKHLETLANGDGQRIIDGMKHEIDIVSTFMKDFSISANQLKAETRIQWIQSNQVIQSADKYASNLDKFQRRVRELESKKSIREILGLQDKMNASRSPVEYGKFNRQLN